MTEETKKTNQWQNLILAAIFAVIGASYFGLFNDLFDSDKATAIKRELNQYANVLESAQEVGDKQLAATLLDPTTKIIQDYLDLSEVKRLELDQSELRFCRLAAQHLSSGVVGVMNTGYWAEQIQFHNAIKACH